MIPSLVTNQKPSNKMLSNFVGGISTTPAFQQPTFMDSLKQQQPPSQQPMFLLPHKQVNEDDLFVKNKSRSTTSSSPNHFANNNNNTDQQQNNTKLRDQIRKTNNDYAELQQKQQHLNRNRQSKSSQSTKR